MSASSVGPEHPGKKRSKLCSVVGRPWRKPRFAGLPRAFAVNGQCATRKLPARRATTILCRCTAGCRMRDQKRCDPRQRCRLTDGRSRRLLLWPEVPTDGCSGVVDWRRALKKGLSDGRVTRHESPDLHQISDGQLSSPANYRCPLCQRSHQADRSNLGNSVGWAATMRPAASCIPSVGGGGLKSPRAAWTIK